MNLNKKINTHFSSLIPLVILFLMTTQSEARAEPNHTVIPTLRLGTEGAFRPFSFYQGPDLTGFEVELGQALSAEMGMKPEWKAYPFEQILKKLNQSEVDVALASHAITPDRKKVALFANPHYCTGAVLVGRAGNLYAMSDLVGKVVGVGSGTTYFNRVRSMKGLKGILVLTKNTEGSEALQNQKIDVWIEDLFVAGDYIKKHPNERLALGSVIFEETVGMAVQKNNPKLLNQINAALDILMKNGVYQKLSEKYFGHDVRCRRQK